MKNRLEKKRVIRLTGYDLNYVIWALKRWNNLLSHFKLNNRPNKIMDIIKYLTKQYKLIK